MTSTEPLTDPIASFAPATGRRLGAVGATPVAAIPACIARARAALPAWRKDTLGRRITLLEAVAEALAADSEPLARLLAEESGKIAPQATFEVTITIDFLRRIAERARSLTAERIPTEAYPALARDLITTRRVPYGVVCAILPFNFPVELYVEKVAAALAVGNVVIVKSPPQTPLVIERMTALFHQAGIPPEVLQLVHGDAAVGAALAAAPGIDLISLTGSTRAGIAVAESSAPQLPRLHLELGGNDPAVVLEDADLALVAPQLVFGRTLMNGQACASNKRVIVHASLHDALAERLRTLLDALTVGDPLDPATQLGPMVDETSAQRVVAQVEHAIAQGAQLLSGTLAARGAYVTPFLLGRVPAAADVACDDEIFGPVLPLIPFDDDDEAVAIANQSSYGLSSCVFGRDWTRATRVADALEAGGTVINGSGNYRPFVIPFGGVKMSGLGREGLGYTLEEMSQLKYTVWRDFLP